MILKFEFSSNSVHQRTEGWAWGAQAHPKSCKKGLKALKSGKNRKIFAPLAQFYDGSLFKPTPSQIFRHATDSVYPSFTIILSTSRLITH